MCVEICFKISSITMISFQQFAKMGKHRLSKTNGIAPIATGNWGCGVCVHKFYLFSMEKSHPK